MQIDACRQVDLILLGRSARTGMLRGEADGSGRDLLHIAVCLRGKLQPVSCLREQRIIVDDCRIAALRLDKLAELRKSFAACQRLCRHGVSCLRGRCFAAEINHDTRQPLCKLGDILRSLTLEGFDCLDDL